MKIVILVIILILNGGVLDTNYVKSVDVLKMQEITIHGVSRGTKNPESSIQICVPENWIWDSEFQYFRDENNKDKAMFYVAWKEGNDLTLNNIVPEENIVLGNHMARFTIYDEVFLTYFYQIEDDKQQHILIRFFEGLYQREDLKSKDFYGESKELFDSIVESIEFL